MHSFEQLLDAYQPMISSVLRKTHIYKDHEIFRQAASIALWKAWQNFDESKGSFAGYAYRTMYGAVLDELKKVSKDLPMEDSFFATFPSVEQEPKMVLLIQSLPEVSQQVLMMSYYYGYTAAEVAEKLALSVPGVKKRKKLALLRLKELLND
ncbi:sigma-70 family RNA polymerase sigma factor [Chryseomicrobium sp. FSL W7-1435]|uniref:sigma-70 family RNA polymerase sigma factor n=1 Tax=Chryseomicrobium sp. FSL W7-1435 TaxID=2921704 RepID=UPI00315B20D3